MLSCDLIREKSGTSIFGNNIYSLNEVDSTNTFILNMSRFGSPEGTIVVAEYQNSGKGKQGRNWFAPKGQNLTFSVLLRPRAEIEHVQKITLAVASTLANTIEKFFIKKGWPQLNVKLKWPNDLLIDGKKVSGILSESVLKDKEIEALAIGIGLNLNTETNEFPDELIHSSSSLIEFSGTHISREELLAMFLKNLELDYTKWERNEYSDVVEQWKKRTDQIGSPIKVITPDGEQDALFSDVDDSGYLIYQTEDGEQKKLISGDIECY